MPIRQDKTLPVGVLNSDGSFTYNQKLQDLLINNIESLTVDTSWDNLTQKATFKLPKNLKLIYGIQWYLDNSGNVVTGTTNIVNNLNKKTQDSFDINIISYDPNKYNGSYFNSDGLKYNPLFNIGDFYQ